MKPLNSPSRLEALLRTTKARRHPFEDDTSSSSSSLSEFSLGDSDANYNTSAELGDGEIPSSAGDIGPNSTTNNSTVDTFQPRSNVFANSLGDLTKSIEVGSNSVVRETTLIGQASSTGLTHNIIDRTDNTDSLTNLFYSFGLPISDTDKNVFSGITSSSGGFSDTALSGLNVDRALVIEIPNADYGEAFDGKEVMKMTRG